jgi:SAM-dependent methyltransferase
MGTHDPIRVFFSYSESKSDKPRALKRAIALTKALIVGRGWTVLDPLADSEVGTNKISSKVFDSLARADLVIAEATDTFPNIMLECGFALSRSVPIIYLVNRAPGQPDPLDRHRLYESYRSLLRLSADRPLPSDLGDVEWFPYAGSVTTFAEEEQFSQRFFQLLTNLSRGPLSTGRVALSRRIRSLRENVHQVAQGIDPDHPLHYLLSEWCDYIRHDMVDGAPFTFKLDAYYYSSALPAFANWNEAVLAIADLTDSTERFWHQRPDPLLTAVRERIFVVSRLDLLDMEKLRPLLEVVAHQSTGYSVRIIDDVTFDRHAPKLPGLSGRNLLVMKPNITASYEVERGRKLVKFDTDPARFQHASTLYDAIEHLAVPVESHARPEDIRQLWMDKLGIGRWNPKWGPVNLREPSYFENYDANIRVWIPGYSELVQLCGRRVQESATQALRRSTRRVRVVEIGYGTGELTEALLSWMSTVNAPFSELGRDETPIQKLVAIDAAESMLERVRTRVEGRHSAVQRDFLIGDAWEKFRKWRPSMAVDVICGSLVLHDLLEGRKPTEVRDLLRRLYSALAPGGEAIFVDVMLDRSRRSSQIAKWKGSMIAAGMSDSDVEVFLEHNSEMEFMMTSDEIKRAALAAGFKDATLKLLHTNSAFGVLSMRKSAESGKRKLRPRSKRR